jgi:hypothetical protein
MNVENKHLHLSFLLQSVHVPGMHTDKFSSYILMLIKHIKKSQCMMLKSILPRRPETVLQNNSSSEDTLSNPLLQQANEATPSSLPSMAGH